MRGKVYYNENDPFAVAWLRNLIGAGHITDGEVDERSIKDVQVSDLRGFTQCHFFAGIGGWSYALRLAGWPDDQPVWTGSCPCQPFSAAGQRKGFNDSRHLWPEWFRLIREHRPVAIFGEQVASALGWFDLVSGELEDEGYAVGAAVVGAHSVGAPHIRQRLYFVADSTESRRPRAGEHERRPSLSSTRPAEHGIVGQSSEGRWGQGRAGEKVHGADSCGEVERSGHDRSVEHPPQQQARLPRLAWESRESFWTDCDWLPCIDSKSRPVEPGTFPLAHGLPSRVGRLRGYGNAIVPQVAAEFIGACMELLEVQP